jgi:hypothetical protein
MGIAGNMYTLTIAGQEILSIAGRPFIHQPMKAKKKEQQDRQGCSSRQKIVNLFRQFDQYG